MRRKALTIAGLSIAALLLGSLAAQASGWSVCPAEESSVEIYVDKPSV